MSPDPALSNLSTFPGSKFPLSSLIHEQKLQLSRNFIGEPIHMSRMLTRQYNLLPTSEKVWHILIERAMKLC